MFVNGLYACLIHTGKSGSDKALVSKYFQKFQKSLPSLIVTNYYQNFTEQWIYSRKGLERVDSFTTTESFVHFDLEL